MVRAGTKEIVKLDIKDKIGLAVLVIGLLLGIWRISLKVEGRLIALETKVEQNRLQIETQLRAR